MHDHGPRRALPLASALALLGILLAVEIPATGQDAPRRMEFTVTGADFRFSPARLEVRQNDLVKISFHAADMAHSFTIDAYRISKRAGAGQTVTFEFRADQAGTFQIYCNLANDERCRQMHGQLVVSP